MFNIMVDSKIVRINRTFYALVPAKEARRLNLREGQLVDVEVRPRRTTSRDALRLFGTRKNIAIPDRRALWGDYGE